MLIVTSWRRNRGGRDGAPAQKKRSVYDGSARPTWARCRDVKTAAQAAFRSYLSPQVVDGARNVAHASHRHDAARTPNSSWPGRSATVTFFSGGRQRGGDKVCVIGERRPRGALRRRPDPLGQPIRVERPFRVIGLLARKGGRGSARTRTTRDHIHPRGDGSSWATAWLNWDLPLGCSRRWTGSPRRRSETAACVSATRIAASRARTDDFAVRNMANSRDFVRAGHRGS